MAGFDARVTIPWGDGDHVFRLALEHLLELQEKTDAGPVELLLRIKGQGWRVQDLRETIRLGLIGGGKTPTEALVLVGRYVDRRPLLESVPVALEIITAALVTPDDAPGKPAAEMETGASPPPPSTDAAPSSGSDPT
ncbi:gene transfer agent family protein [Xanthobacter sediminis]